MNITSLMVGPIMTNCYVVWNETEKVCAVVDPGDEPERIERAIRATGCELQAIWLTHGHFDHCNGVAGLVALHPDVPVYIHEADVADKAGRSGWDLKFPRLDEKNMRYLHEGDTLTLGNLTFTVWETPGHSAGSVCLIGPGVIFCGDTLFRGSCGRTDFPDGSYEAILRSLGRLGRLEGDYRCCCGHEGETTLNAERAFNPYLRQGMAL